LLMSPLTLTREDELRRSPDEAVVDKVWT